MSDREQPRRVLITGGSGGIGGAIAAALASDGHQVTVADLNGSSLAGVDSVVVDLSTRHGNLTAVAGARLAMGGVDAVIPCAGFQSLSAIADFDEDVWDRMLAVMLTSPFLLAKYAWPDLVESGRGRFVALASAHSHVAAPAKAGYVSAKHGLLGLVRALAADGAPVGVGAVAVCPGYVGTDMVRARVDAIIADRGLTRAKAEAAFVDGTHLVGQMVPVDAVVDTVRLSLTSSGLAFTGSTFTPDMGYTAQ